MLGAPGTRCRFRKHLVTAGSRLVGAIETGGTKIVCAVGTGVDDVRVLDRFPTTTDPVQTIERAVETILAGGSSDLSAIGVGSFGPCDPDPTSPTFGRILATPKPGWADTDVVGTIRAALAARGVAVPIAFDTDVNAALVGEMRAGAARESTAAIYVTIGTGIGGGAALDGTIVHGQRHPEMGHIRVPRQTGELPDFAGVCPFHGDCWEGLASGPALAARWQLPGPDLADDHPAWDLEARYVAAGLHALACVLSPQVIVVGGGVGLHPVLLQRVRPILRESLAGYLDLSDHDEGLTSYVVPAGLPDLSGVTGAICLALDAVNA